MKSFKTYIREVALGTGSSGIARYNDELHRVSEEDVKELVEEGIEISSIPWIDKKEH